MAQAGCVSALVRCVLCCVMYALTRCSLPSLPESPLPKLFPHPPHPCTNTLAPPPCHYSPGLQVPQCSTRWFALSVMRLIWVGPSKPSGCFSTTNSSDLLWRKAGKKSGGVGVEWSRGAWGKRECGCVTMRWVLTRGEQGNRQAVRKQDQQRSKADKLRLRHQRNAPTSHTHTHTPSPSQLVDAPPLCCRVNCRLLHQEVEGLDLLEPLVLGQLRSIRLLRGWVECERQRKSE